MELSPGVELVWSLAGRETVHARVAEVAPDHFFCALLKFAELGADELARLTTEPAAAEAAQAERQALLAALDHHGLKDQTRQLRHALRQAMDHGQVEHAQGDTLHRSEASRRLFERGARLARREKRALQAPHLFSVLIEDPTPAMLKVLPASARRDAPPPAEAPAWLRAVGKPPTQTGGGGPQVSVVAWALGLPDPTPILLICDAKVDAAAIVTQAAASLPEDAGLIQVDLAAIRKAAGQDSLAAEAVNLLRQAGPDSHQTFFLDLTRQKTAGLAAFIAAVLGAAGEHPQTILAVSAADYASHLRDQEDLDSGWRLIWLHELGDQEIPTRL